MSYILDGKIVNQAPRYRFNSGNPTPTCAKCNKLISSPETSVLKTETKTHYLVFHYIGKSEFIYETKSGHSVVYCSEYCRNKHNHRFKQ